MKTNHLRIALAFVAACLVSTTSVKGQVPQVVVDSGTEFRQNITVDNHVSTTQKAPMQFTTSQRTLLEDLAADETIAGNWFNDRGTVPPGAKVVVTFAGPGDFSSLSYQVVTPPVHGHAASVNVSNILSAKLSGSNSVTSYTFVDIVGANEPPFTTTSVQQFTITYDSRPIGGRVWFQITGLATCKTVATKPNAKTGVYTETDSFSLADGTGFGVDPTETQFVLKGVTVTASGAASLNCGCGSDQVGPSAAGVSAGQSLGDEFSSGASDEQVSAPPADIQSFQLDPTPTPPTH